MLFKQLKYFITVVDCNSFTKAADECYISQSAISQQIRSLEEDLGVALMIRANRSFVLTAAGQYLYNEGKMLLNDYERIRLETIEVDKGIGETLKIGYPANYVGMDLESVIQEFSKAYPRVKLTLMSGNHEKLFKDLVDEKIDMKLSEQRRAFNEDDYENYVIQQCDCMVEIAKDNPLSVKELLTTEDLKDMSCIVIASKEYQKSEREFFESALNISKNFIYATSIEEARLLVSVNHGYIVVDALGKQKALGDTICRIPLYKRNKPVQRNYFICWSKDNENPYIELFAKRLKEKILLG